MPLDGELPPPAIGREIVRHERDLGLAKASLAQTDTSARDKKFDEIIRERAADRHHIPEDNADEDDPPPVAAIHKMADRKTDRTIEEGKRSTLQQADLDIVKRQVLLDMGDEQRKYRAIEERNHTRKHQEAGDVSPKTG